MQGTKTLSPATYPSYYTVLSYVHEPNRWYKFGHYGFAKIRDPFLPPHTKLITAPWAGQMPECLDYDYAG